MARSPRIALAAPDEGEQQRADATDDQRGAEVVDRVLTTLEGHVQHGVDHDQRHDAQRHVDVEDPAPGQVLGEEATEQRSGDAGQAPDAGEVARVAATFARRDDVADDRERQRHQAAGAESLQGPGRDQLPHRLRHPGEHRAGDEHHDREDVDGATSVEVGDLAVQRGRRRRREQVGRDHPGELVEPAQLSDDRRQGGRDDGLVEGSEQHAEHQAAEHHHDLPVRHVGRAGGCRRLSVEVTQMSPSWVGSGPARRTGSRQSG